MLGWCLPRVGDPSGSAASHRRDKKHLFASFFIIADQGHSRPLRARTTLFQRIAVLLPAIDSTEQCFGVVIALLAVFGRQTGGTVFGSSGAIEDDFSIFGKVGNAAFKLLP
jgi:hypothetical protein